MSADRKQTTSIESKSKNSRPPPNVQQILLSQCVPQQAPSPLVQLLEGIKGRGELIAGIRKKFAATSPSPSSGFDLTPEEQDLLFQLFASRGSPLASGIKRFEYAFTANSATTAATTQGISCVNIAQGDDYNQRLGRGVRLHKSHVRIVGEFQLADQTFASFVNPLARTVIVADKMAPLGTSWADNANPTTSQTALMQTLGMSTSGNTCAFPCYSTEGIRYHKFHDHWIAAPKVTPVTTVSTAGTGDVLAAGTTTTQGTPTQISTNYLYGGPAEKEFICDWNLTQTYTNTTGTTQLTNEILYWTMQDVNASGLFGYNITVVTYFEDEIASPEGDP